MRDEIRIGLLGFGTVGSAFAAVLDERRGAVEARYGVRLLLTQIAVSRPRLPRVGAGSVPVHGDAARLAADSAVDVLVEATDTPDAAAWLLAAHARGATIVSANKQALAGDPRLLRLLAAHDPRLHCEAAAAGALPIVRALRTSLAGDEVLSLRGVLNGTTTFVLSRLEAGAGLAESIVEARRLGYAEADPSYDLDGRDAAAKLAILCTVAWRTPLPPDRVATMGVGEEAERLVREARAEGRHVRLVASARRGGDALVAPQALNPSDTLASTAGVENVVEIEASVAGRLVWRAPGAGGRATASALLADTVAAARAIAGSSIADRDGRSASASVAKVGIP